MMEDTPRQPPRPDAMPRLSRNKIPLAVRKELLTTRAALERYDCAEAARHLRASVRGATGMGWMPSIVAPKNWLRVFGLARQYPYLSSVVSLVATGLRGTRIGHAAWRVSKYGMLAGTAYYLYKLWRGNADSDNGDAA